MENENEPMIFQGEFELEILDESVHREENRVVLRGPLLPSIGTQQAEDIHTTVTLWREQERLQNRINELLNENADLKSERDAKKMAIEGLSLARERLHKEQAAMKEELDKLKEEIKNTKEKSHEAESKSKLLQVGVAGGHYDGVIITLDEALQEVGTETLGAMVLSLQQQAHSYGLLTPQDISQLDTVKPAGALYVKINTKNLEKFLNALSSAIGHTLHEGASDEAMPIMVGSSWSTGQLSVSTAEPSSHSEDHSVSTPDLSKVIPLQSSRIFDSAILTEDIQGEVTTHDAKVEATSEDLQLGPPDLQQGHQDLQQGNQDLQQGHQLGVQQQERKRSQQENWQRRGQPIAVIDPQQQQAEEAGADEWAQQCEGSQLAASTPSLTPWHFDPPSSSHDKLLQVLSSGEEPLPDQGSSSSKSADEGLELLATSMHQGIGTHLLDIPTYNVAHMLRSHHMPPLSSDHLQPSTSDPVLPVATDVMEAQVEATDRLQDLVVSVQHENNQLRNINRNLRHSLAFITSQWAEHTCDRQVARQSGAGLELCARMTLGFLLHALITSFIRSTFGM